MKLTECLAALRQGRHARREGWSRFASIWMAERTGDLWMSLAAGQDHWSPSIRDLEAGDWQSVPPPEPLDYIGTRRRHHAA